MKTDLRLAIDTESVNIYIERGASMDPINLIYYHEDEVKEDSSEAFTIANVIHEFHTNRTMFLRKLGGYDTAFKCRWVTTELGEQKFIFMYYGQEMLTVDFIADLDYDKICELLNEVLLENEHEEIPFDYIELKESDDGIGIILDFWDDEGEGAECVNTSGIWYDDFIFHED